MAVSHTQGTSGTRLAEAGEKGLSGEHCAMQTRESSSALAALDHVEVSVSFREYAMAERLAYSCGACEKKRATGGQSSNPCMGSFRSWRGIGGDSFCLVRRTKKRKQISIVRDGWRRHRCDNADLASPDA